jgi:hypothetical protein
MALLDTTALAAVLKQKYTQRRFNLLCYKKNPFYALIPKITDFGGKNKVISLRFGVPQGRGASIAAAQAGKTASAYGAFTVTRASDYATASITGEAIAAAKGDENTLIEGLTKEIDGTIHVCMRSLAIAMYRNGGGARGQISSGSNVATTTITLANLSDVSNFEVNMLVQFASDDGSASSPAGLRNGGATATITGVDRDLGTLTFATNVNTAVPAVQTSDYIFQGNTNQANSDYGKMVKGLAAWLPATAPTSTDNFFGLNRSTDVTRLAGVRYNGNGGPIEETLVEAATRLQREGSSPDHVFMHPFDWSNLVKALGSKVIYDRAQSVDEPEFGFKAVALEGPEGPIKVVSDLNCPKGTGYMVQLDTWHLESLGEAPRILDLDGNTILRSANSDDYEVRIGYYAQPTCEAPGWNANITF